MSYEFYNEDAITFLCQLPDASVDLVIADPPYESLEKYRAIGTTTRLKVSKGSSNPWFQIFKNELFLPFLNETYRVLKNDRHLYFFCDAETLFHIKPIGETAGFKFWKPLVWNKISFGMGYHYRNQYEFIVFFEKGKRKLNNFSIPDVISIKKIFRGYPTEKPTELMELLILQSTRQNELVIDPFMGSGSSGLAALKTKRTYKGNDISLDAYLLAKEKLVKKQIESTNVIEEL